MNSNNFNDFIIIKSKFLSIIHLLVDNQEINQLDHMFVSFHISNLKIKYIYRPINWSWKVNDKRLKILIDFFFYNLLILIFINIIINIYWYFFFSWLRILLKWYFNSDISYLDYFIILKFPIIQFNIFF